MNILVYELKSHWKKMIIWTFFLLLFLFAYVFGIYPIFKHSMQNIKQMVSGFPPEFSKAFGFDLTSMFEYSGFYVFLFPYLVLIGSIMTSYFTIAIFGAENRSHCEDFLFTKPIKRATIFLSKLSSVFLLILFSNIFFIAASMYLFHKYGVKKHIIIASTCLLLTEILFVAFSVLYTIFAKKIRSIAGIACGFGFIGFILSAVTRLMNETYLNYISPYAFFDPAPLWKVGHLKISYLIWGIILIIIALLLSFLHYCKKDSRTI